MESFLIGRGGGEALIDFPRCKKKDKKNMQWKTCICYNHEDDVLMHIYIPANSKALANACMHMCQCTQPHKLNLSVCFTTLLQLAGGL